MEDVFKIFVEQLREGKEQDFEEVLDPVFLDVNEKDLRFNDPVDLSGKVYLAEQELVIRWSVWTYATISCSICNEPVRVPITIENSYHCEPLSEIKTGVFNFKDLLRETILLEVPPFAECEEGNCPKRKDFAKYLKDSTAENSEQEEGHHPFADLDWKS